MNTIYFGYKTRDEKIEELRNRKEFQLFNLSPLTPKSNEFMLRRYDVKLEAMDDEDLHDEFLRVLHVGEEHLYPLNV